MLLHGNLMCWRQFENVIPLLEEEFDVYAVSFDGFDGTGKTTYTTAQEQADKLEAYLIHHCGGSLDALFAESLGCGPAVCLKASKNIRIRRMILSGPEYLDFGILNPLILKIMPQKQYQTAKTKTRMGAAFYGADRSRYANHAASDTGPCQSGIRLCYMEGWTVPVPLDAGTSAGRGCDLLVRAAGGTYEESH